MDTDHKEGALPFGFAVPLLVPLAFRVMELLGDPLGELNQEVECKPADYPIEELRVTTWTDSRGHRLVQRHEQDFKQPYESYDRRCEARLEGIHGRATIILSSPLLIDTFRFYKIDGADTATARECVRAWTIALIERAHAGRLVAGFELPPELETRARAQLRDAALVPPAQYEPRLLVFPPARTSARSGIQHLGDLGSWFELNVVGPLPRDGDAIEAIHLIRPTEMDPVAPRPDAVLIAHVLLDGSPTLPWHLQVTDQPRGSHRTLFSMRLQHEEGEGPAAFVQWYSAKRPLGHQEGIDALFIGTARQVREAIERLSNGLDLKGWKSAPSKLASGEQWL